LDLNAFVDARRSSWRRLEQLVARLEASGPGALADFMPHAPGKKADPAPKTDATGKEKEKTRPVAGEARTVAAARELAQLYREACGDLIRARSETANSELIGYLNGLVGRAYSVIYRGRRFRLLSIARFALVEFPRRLRARWGYLAASAAVFFLGLAFGWIAEANDPTAKHFLVPADVAKLEDEIMKSPAANGGTAMPPAVNLLMSTGIMTNNIQVSFGAFASGGTAGIGTAGVLFYNGVLLGDLAAIFARHHLSEGFWALILPHGVIELTAIFIAGAAGFLIARALIAPGDMGRRAALACYGREAVELAIGCAILLVPAGLIEGFITPQPGIPAGAKIGIGALTGLFLLAYLVWNEPLLEQLGFLEALRVEVAHGPLRRAPGFGE
jgi:uncharacterized membrane protein SpoIIM required for sporulation